MIVLDTHVFLWHAVESKRLSRPARQAIAGAAELGVAAISAFEIALLVRHGRLTLDRPTLSWLRRALELPRIRLLSLDPEISAAAAELDWDHRDPADRLIVATARAHRAPLVTKDERIRKYLGELAIW